jgi:AcrR family transcriptional regulator
MVNEEMVKAEILSVAGGLIQQFGIQKVTMQDIAKAAGKGKSTLYYYFKSKEEILDAVLDKEMKDFYLQFETAMEKESTFEEKLRTYIITKIKTVESKVKDYAFLIENDDHYFDFNNYFKKMRFLYDNKELRLITSLFQHGLETGVIDEKNLSEENKQLTAEIFLTCIRGLEMEVFIHKKIKNFNEKVDIMINLLLNGLR